VMTTEEHQPTINRLRKEEEL